MSIQRAYAERVARSGLAEDPQQIRVVRLFQELEQRIVTETAPLRRLWRRLRPPSTPERSCGIYLWGGVGRGKTMLMDLFFTALPVRRKRRVHFHRMMAEVHARLRALADTEDPLDRVAADIAKDTDVLCFDEFFVADIADAMILGRLMQGLFARRVFLVATSNSAPSDLYAGGLQRERFLPAIQVLETRTTVIELAGDEDYRLRLLQQAGTFLYPAGRDADAKLDRYFRDIASGVVLEGAQIEVLGRNIAARKSAKGIAWFDFEALCEGPRSQQDYIEIARWYSAVIVSSVPTLDASRENAARRFIALVDEFYDRRVKLILSAAAPLSSLYSGRQLRFEFERTTSRLAEMQTDTYLHSPHLS